MLAAFKFKALTRTQKSYSNVNANHVTLVQSTASTSSVKTLYIYGNLNVQPYKPTVTATAMSYSATAGGDRTETNISLFTIRRQFQGV